MKNLGKKLKRQKRRGFTLTEMLVVLGILLLLMSLLFPAILKAQQQAKVTQCQARLKSLGQAFQLYITQNDQTLPPGTTSNSIESSISMASFNREGISTGAGIMGGLMPPDASKKPLFDGAQGFGYPHVPVAYFMQKIIPPVAGNWSCPTWRTGKPGKFRSYQFVSEPQGLIPPTTDGSMAELQSSPLTGTGLGVFEFRPGYMYMSGVENAYSLNKAKTDQWHFRISTQYHYGDFAARSISGLKLSEIKPSDKRGQDSVVVMLDYNLSAHSNTADDIWGEAPDPKNEATWAPQPADPDALTRSTGAYKANFLFLDGHTETRAFKSIEGFFNILHAPIRQPW